MFTYTYIYAHHLDRSSAPHTPKPDPASRSPKLPQTLRRSIYIYISISRSAFPANYRPRLYTRSNSTIHTHTLELYVCGFFILRARVWRESDSRAKRGLLRARLVTSNLVIIDRLAPNTAQAIEIPRIHHIHITIHHIYDMLPTMRCERVLHVIYYIRI